MPGFENADEYVRYTAIRGTLVHYNVLNSVVRGITGKLTLDMSDLPPLSDYIDRVETIKKEVAHCRKLWDDLGFDIRPPFSAESAWYHKSMLYAGTKDLKAKIEGVNTVLDLKTSARIYDKHLIQAAAYVQMDRSWGAEIEQGMVISLNPKKAKAMVRVIEGDELSSFIEEFNERYRMFWALPGVRKEYGV